MQGVSKTVHMKDRDLVFERRGAFYVADIREWLQADIEDKEVITPYAFVTEDMYRAKEIKKANEAGVYIASAGYPSLEEAIR